MMKNDEEKYFYPEAEHWMWNYCIFLGKFVDSRGEKWDLGIHVRDNELHKDKVVISGAIVNGNEPGDYYSPCFNFCRQDEYEKRIHTYSPAEAYIETIKRAREKGYNIR
jgi:hypothetical protein